MDWGDAMRIASILEREVIYGAYRGADPSLDEAKLAKLVIWNRALAIIESFVSVVLILLMIGAPVLLSGPGELVPTMRTSVMLYNVLMFVTVLMVSSTYALSLQMSGSLRALAHLPIGMSDMGKVVIARLSYALLPILMVPAIYGAIVAEKLCLIQAFPLVVLYGYADALLALAASLILSSVLSKKMGSSRGIRGRLVRAFLSSLYIITMFSIGILYQLYMCSSGVVKIVGEAISSIPEGTAIIYPFSASEAVFSSREPVGLTIALATCTIYTAVFYLAFKRALKSYVISALEGPLGAALGGYVRKPRLWLCWPSLNIAIKDLKIAIRDPRTAYIIVLPLFSLLSFLPAIFNAGSMKELEENIFLMCMTLLVVGCVVSSLVPHQLMEHEGGRLWVMFSTAFRRRDLALGKSLATAIPYACYAIPISLVSSLIVRNADLLLFALSGSMICATVALSSAMTIAASISVDTRMIRISLLRSLGLMAIATALSIPLVGPMVQAGVVGLTADPWLTLTVSALELGLALAVNWLLLR